jgi:hypothetical protein
MFYVNVSKFGRTDFDCKLRRKSLLSKSLAKANSVESTKCIQGTAHSELLYYVPQPGSAFTPKPT